MKNFKRLLLYCSPFCASMACHAGDAIPQAVPSQGPQVMLYFRQPLWSPGAHRVYGLRLEQASAPSAAPTALGFNPLRRREILSFEIGQHADMRVQFDRRWVWDVNRQEFGLGSPHPTLALQLPQRTPTSAESIHTHP